VHAATARLNQTQGPAAEKAKAAARLRSAYRQLGEEPPDVIKANADDIHAFRRGAGWVTHPRETRRIHDYWVVGEGRAKIRWGTGGDFTRCTRYLRKYISPVFLHRTCAQWHHDALGYWPGERGRPGNPPKGSNDVTAHPFHLVAAAPRPSYPTSWFDDPGFTGPTPLTVEPNGRVYGHLATWGTCHIGIDGVCVTPPQSRTDYAYFHLGVVDTDDGRLAVGSITLDTGHANLDLRAFDARRHYDDTGTVVAKVRAGEDEHGIWVAGALCDVPDDVRLTLASSAGLSGDWREVAGNLELVAALAVNVPGFPVPRVGLAASAGGQHALVAAGIVQPYAVLTDDFDLLALAAAVVAEIERKAERQQRLAKVRGARLSALRDRMAMVGGD
jgi:hypothetical protein